MRYHSILPESYVDGPGRRAVLFLQGCTLACPGCQNAHLWPADGGYEADPLALASSLLHCNSRAVTISGGEPFQQPDELALLLGALHAFAPADSPHVIVYTGYTWEELLDLLPTSLFARILNRVDVLVDGRFRRDLDHGLVQYRGSPNQRPVNIHATLAAGGLVLDDWDTPEVVVTADGSVIAPAGLHIADGVGRSTPTRRCGQTRTRMEATCRSTK